MKLTVKTKLLGVLVLVLVVSIGAMLFALLYQEEALKHKQADNHIDELSYSIIQSIVFIMDQGADDVSPIVKEMSNIENISELRVIATELIDEEKASKMDSLEKIVVAQKERIALDEIFGDKAVHRAVYSIPATESCLNCHAGEVGDPLAVISLRYSVQDTYDSIAGQRMSGTIMLLVIVVLSLGFLYIAMNRLVINDLNRTTAIMHKFSEGDLSEKIANTRNDEFGDFLEALEKVRNSINNMAEDAVLLSESAKNGILDRRADITKHKGEYAKIIIGLNQTLESVVSPLKLASDYISRISKGDIPPKIEKSFEGDYNELISSINMCIDAVSKMIDDTNKLVESATLGKLNDRADASKHLGDFRKIILGVNSTLDRLVGMIDNMPVPVQIVDKEYNILYLNKEAADISKD